MISKPKPSGFNPLIKADQEDVNRILNGVLEQGNGEEIDNWIYNHYCGHCQYKKCYEELKKEFKP
jgi:hypothetical protein